MRKPIEESTAHLVATLKTLSAQDRDNFVRCVLKAARDHESASRFEEAAIAIDSLCYSIDGTTEVMTALVAPLLASRSPRA